MQLYAININHSNCHKKRNVHFECGRARTNEEAATHREKEGGREEATAKETRQANLQLKCLSQDKFCAYAKVGRKDIRTGQGRVG